MNKLESHGLDRLKHRIERLRRLLQLEAPPLIANEIHMIVDAMKMYSPEAWYKALKQSEMRALKLSCGFCSQDGCDERRDYDAKELSDMCTKHIAEFNEIAEDCEAVLSDDDIEGMS
jgi:hypothetical protein